MRSSDQKSLTINIVKRKLISSSEKWSPSPRSARASPTLPMSLSLKDLNPKFTYYLRTIESFEEYVDPIEEVIHTSFLPSLFGRAEPLPEELYKELVSLSPAQGSSMPRLI